MRTKTLTSLMLAVGLFAFSVTALHAQVGINPTGTAPSVNASLDLNTGGSHNLGFIPTSVSLSALSTFNPPIANAATPGDVGMIVYNTNAAVGTGIGYYYWNGTQWISLSGGSITGSGIDNYVARWTPNGTTLGTGLIQDNGTSVGINSAPNAGDMLYVTSALEGAAVYAVNTGTTSSEYGVWGEDDNWIGIYGTAANASEVGVWGEANGEGAAGMVAYSLGGSGIEAVSSDTIGYAVLAVNEATKGTGIYASGDTAINAFGAYDGITAYGTGQWGVFSRGIGGVIGYGQEIGVAGVDTLGDEGLLGYYAGFGVYSIGVDYGGGFFDGNGDATYIADNGDEDGIYATGVENGGYFQDDVGASSYDLAYIADAGVSAGGYFQDAAGDYAYIAYAGDAILGSGAKSTLVKDDNNQMRVMYCNESPEVMFEDYGQGQLVNGSAHINLDPLLAKHVAITEQHPLRVYIQLEGDCNGVFVTNKSASGFDVKELMHGTSNATFQWHIVCNRANEPGQYHNYADKRFPVGPGPLAAKPRAKTVNKPSVSLKTSNLHSGAKHAPLPKHKVAKGSAQAKLFDKMGKN